MKTLYCVSDSNAWVQKKRLKLLSDNLADFEFKDSVKYFRLFLFLNFAKKIVYFLSWRILLKNDLWKKVNLSNCVTSVTSHYNIGGGLNPEKAVARGKDKKQVFEKAIEVLSKFKAVSVNSMRLFELLKDRIDNLYYLPNGVDEKFYYPKNKSYNPQNIRIGWVGKIKAAKNYELIDNLKSSFEDYGIEFCEIALNKTNSKVKSSEEVREFYHSIDFYLCTSWHEGTPNPCLEAASCGVPLITTRVGNMPELIIDNFNGYFINCEIDSVYNVIDKIKLINSDDYQRLSHNIRESICKDWTWGKRFKEYECFFNKVFENGKK